MDKTKNSFGRGLRDGIPIALGYLSVSFTFGIQAIAGGLDIANAMLISMTNLTSAGQFAGLSVIVAGGGYLEMALTQLVINLRYALMSLSLSQKLDRSFSVLDRLFVSFGNTDEIFAVATSRGVLVDKLYMYGLIALPYAGWSIGTLLGALAGSILPASVRSALSVAIYAMFIAIIVPPAKKLRGVRVVVAVAVLLSCLFAWTPGLNKISGGFAVIVCATVAAAVGALFFPVRNHEAGQKEEAG